MKSAQPVKFGAWFLLFINVLMAFACIWIFMRMSPAIEVIMTRNETSLQACESMLAALAQPTHSDGSALKLFQQAFIQAKEHTTEVEEPAAIERIAQSYPAAFQGDKLALERTVSAIRDVADINRKAMRAADAKAKQFGHAGAWGVVFMASASFLIGMVFLHALDKHLVEPIQEIDEVLNAFRQGETQRRCALKEPPKSIRRFFANVNQVLDMYSALAAADKEEHKPIDS